MSRISYEEFEREEEASRERRERIEKQKMMFYLKSGDTARLRLLTNFTSLTAFYYHYVYAARPEDGVRAVCAAENGKLCVYCQQAKRNRDLVARQYIALPIWVYEIKNPHATEEELEKYDDRAGYRILTTARSSDIMGDLHSYFKAVKSVTGCDWQYSRTGTGKTGTTYKMTALPPTPFELADDISVPDEDEVMRLVTEAFPIKAIATSPVESPF